ncbi:hypothetical protein L873DRAFT_1754505, partial [Choiromyces venosus 120613-1]
MKFFWCFSCFGCKRSQKSNWISANISASIEAPPTPPTTCFILGLSGAGKSTFLCRIKTGQFQQTKPTADYDVQEIPLPNQMINFTEIASSDRRNFRLQFLRSRPPAPIAVLFFIDASKRDPEVIMKSLEELVYALMYARSRECRVLYLGIVLNKQDLLLGGDDRRVGVRGLEVLKGMVGDTMKKLLSQQQQKEEQRDVQELVVVPQRWEVFADGVSMKTGVGVERILSGVGAGVMIEEREE